MIVQRDSDPKHTTKATFSCNTNRACSSVTENKAEGRETLKEAATEDGHIKYTAEHIKGENADWVMTMGSRHHQTRIFGILDNISYPIIFQALKIVDCIKRALIPKQLMQFLELKLNICSCLV